MIITDNNWPQKDRLPAKFQNALHDNNNIDNALTLTHFSYLTKYLWRAVLIGKQFPKKPTLQIIDFCQFSRVFKLHYILVVFDTVLPNLKKFWQVFWNLPIFYDTTSSYSNLTKMLLKYYCHLQWEMETLLRHFFFQIRHFTWWPYTQ